MIANDSARNESFGRQFSAGQPELKPVGWQRVHTPRMDHALDLVRQVIDAEQPQNIDPASVIVIGECPEVGTCPATAPRRL